MMLYIFHATSCLPPFNIAVTGEREGELTDTRSRNSHPVSMGFSPWALFICTIWSCWLLIDTLLSVCACVFYSSRNHSRAAAYTCYYHYIPREACNRTVSVIWLFRCFSVAFSQQMLRATSHELSFTCHCFHLRRCCSYICFSPFFLCSRVLPFLLLLLFLFQPPRTWRMSGSVRVSMRLRSVYIRLSLHHSSSLFTFTLLTISHLLLMLHQILHFFLFLLFSGIHESSFSFHLKNIYFPVVLSPFISSLFRLLSF